MAKKKAPGVLNRPMYSRISFLYQAATYLAASSLSAETHPDARAPQAQDVAVDIDMNDVDYDTSNNIDTPQKGKPVPAVQNMSRRLLSQMRATTLKSQIRISPSIKRTICKYCDTLLIEGQTCSSVVENKSKGGKKSWADTLVVKCHTCSREKRFPVNAPKQKRRTLRAPDKTKAAAQEAKLPSQPQEQSGT